jgi:hypothetical protein
MEKAIETLEQRQDDFDAPKIEQKINQSLIKSLNYQGLSKKNLQANAKKSQIKVNQV